MKITKITASFTTLTLSAAILAGCVNDSGHSAVTADATESFDAAVTAETIPATDRPQPVTVPDSLPLPPDTEAVPTDIPAMQKYKLALPDASSVFSTELALDLLDICTGGSASNTERLFNEYGFQVIFQKNYDKKPDDKSHTCAFTIGKQVIDKNGKKQTVILTAVRATSGAEWYSNFDFASSLKNDAVFAENFYHAAEEVYSYLSEIIKKENDPTVIVCGHSRGAACSNLTGVLLNKSNITDPNRTFIYTFASPTTVRGSEAGYKYPNIFNVINPCDTVTKVPLKQWGFSRAGNDIILYGDPKTVKKIDNAMDVLHGIVPDTNSYYDVRHSLTEKGSENGEGLTVYELMLKICGATDFSSGRGLLSSGLLSLLLISKESDFAPIVTLLRDSLSAEGEYGIFSEHMPERYRTLLSALN